MNYTTKQGKQLIKYMSYLARDVLKEWEESFPHTSQINWKEVWNKHKKNLGFHLC
jgi:hypothetical protein